MPPPDSNAIDTALVSKLWNDSALRALMPGGVYFDYAPANMDRFVIVSLDASDDVPRFNGRAIESARYLVKAVQRATGRDDVAEAAARIDVLLEDQTLTAAGYGCVACYREERVRFVEVDDLDASIRWQHRGAHYRIQMTPLVE